MGLMVKRPPMPSTREIEEIIVGILEVCKDLVPSKLSPGECAELVGALVDLTESRDLRTIAKAIGTIERVKKILSGIEGMPRDLIEKLDRLLLVSIRELKISP